MSDDTLKIKRKLSVLINSLDDLETGLAALLPELVLSLDTLQQAKLQVVIPYLVYDLVFVYLKTRGLDPKTHPVIAELDRVRQYFDKIKDAEDPVKRQLAIDRAAATRFIKHAIAQAKDTTPGNGIGSGPTTHLRFEANEATHPVHVPVKATTKMLEREQYRETLREEPSEEGSNDLAVIDSDESEDADGSFGSPGQVSGFKAGKGKAKSMGSSARDVSTSTSETWAEKRRRPPIDPFSGLHGFIKSYLPTHLLP
ncbi:hypothetical protein B0F90DRAFT_1680184 [Multifurca ochricompacta]|uniref:Exosome complex protein n=1 Tax=Multifurca ochricompacta TaxID=376703 RepID=A0AAD4MGV4_9AGAM|nr:hypothetical protein B0F90DRAFT_1680184 [Multifurca ochricompacta]